MSESDQLRRPWTEELPGVQYREGETMTNAQYGQIGDTGTLSIHGVAAEEIDRWEKITGEHARVLNSEGRDFITLTFVIGTVEIKLFS